MLVTFLLLAGIEFGVERSCDDNSIVVLDEFITKVRPYDGAKAIFEPNSIHMKAAHKPYCSYVNSDGILQFDVSEGGQITNIKVISMNPPHDHYRRFIHALKNGKVLKSLYGKKGIKVRFEYVQYQLRT